MKLNALKTLFTCLILATALSTAFANNNCPNCSTEETTPIGLPKVFLLGEVEEMPFEKLKADYPTALLDACKGDMELAYYLWMSMFKNLESFAAQKKFDLTGVKLWVYIFWNKDGSIDHFAYYPMPQSRNVKTEDLTKLFNEFVPTFKMALKLDRSYSNYNHIAFPLSVENIAKRN